MENKNSVDLANWLIDFIKNWQDGSGIRMTVLQDFAAGKIKNETLKLIDQGILEVGDDYKISVRKKV